jgi:hypothetical protein
MSFAVFVVGQLVNVQAARYSGTHILPARDVKVTVEPAPQGNIPSFFSPSRGEHSTPTHLIVQAVLDQLDQQITKTIHDRVTPTEFLDPERGEAQFVTGVLTDKADLTGDTVKKRIEESYLTLLAGIRVIECGTDELDGPFNPCHGFATANFRNLYPIRGLFMSLARALRPLPMEVLPFDPQVPLFASVESPDLERTLALAHVQALLSLRAALEVPETLSKSAASYDAVRKRDEHYQKLRDDVGKIQSPFIGWHPKVITGNPLIDSDSFSQVEPQEVLRSGLATPLAERFSTVPGGKVLCPNPDFTGAPAQEFSDQFIHLTYKAQAQLDVKKVSNQFHSKSAVRDIVALLKEIGIERVRHSQLYPFIRSLAIYFQLRADNMEMAKDLLSTVLSVQPILVDSNKQWVLPHNGTSVQFIEEAYQAGGREEVLRRVTDMPKTSERFVPRSGTAPAVIEQTLKQAIIYHKQAQNALALYQGSLYSESDPLVKELFAPTSSFGLAEATLKQSRAQLEAALDQHTRLTRPNYSSPQLEIYGPQTPFPLGGSLEDTVALGVGHSSYTRDLLSVATRQKIQREAPTSLQQEKDQAESALLAHRRKAKQRS